MFYTRESSSHDFSNLEPNPLGIESDILYLMHEWALVIVDCSFNLCADENRKEFGANLSNFVKNFTSLSPATFIIIHYTPMHTYCTSTQATLNDNNSNNIYK